MSFQRFQNTVKTEDRKTVIPSTHCLGFYLWVNNRVLKYPTFKPDPVGPVNTIVDSSESVEGSRPPTTGISTQTVN